MNKVAAYYDRVAEGYGNQYDASQLMTMDEYPANYFRLQIILRRLRELKALFVYEVGVGDGTALEAIRRDLGCLIDGCDISPKMAEIASQRLGKHFECRDIEKSFVTGDFDVVIANGVLPHISDEARFFGNVHRLLNSNGRAFIEFRNKLFSLFSFNRYTKQFILDDLLAGVSPILRAGVATDLQLRLNTSDPPEREFDQIAKFHNPFELVGTFEKNGFQVVDTHWYHFHPAPPSMEKGCGEAFRRAAMAMEGDTSWRGAFLCSAGLIEAQKI